MVSIAWANTEENSLAKEDAPAFGPAEALGVVAVDLEVCREVVVSAWKSVSLDDIKRGWH